MCLKEFADKQKLSKSMSKYLSLAVRIAMDSDNRYQHGAVVVKGGRVISFAPNISKNAPTLFMREFPNDVKAQKLHIREHSSVHAEEKAVKLAGANARGSVVYVARINGSGKPLLSKPCDNCQKILNEAGVKAVVYTSGE